MGVIAADALTAQLRAALSAAGLDPADPADPADPDDADDAGDAGDARVTVLPATLAEGLEYDHVVVVEPAAIVAGEPRGLHRLYVALTRAVSRLTVLHAEPLPAPLAG